MPADPPARDTPRGMTVGHRSTLKEFHDSLLEVHKDGTADLSALSK